MRRSDREVKDVNMILEIIKKCDTVRLALNNEGYPYIVPLNFGMNIEDGNIVLYFHSAIEGKKIDLIKKDNRASFEMDTDHSLKFDESRGYCTMMYQSVIGKGVITILDESEKSRALEILCNMYHKDGFKFSSDAIPRTCVYKLTVSEITGKIKE